MLWLIALLACGVDKTPDDTEDRSEDTETGDSEDTGPADTIDPSGWENTGGCGDTFLHATSADGTWALWFRDDSGMAERAHTSGEVQTDTYDLSMDYALSPTVAIQQGSDLSVQFCTDVVEPYTVDEEWYGTSGSLTISVEANGEPKDWGAWPAEATLTLEEVTFTTLDAEDVHLEAFTMTAQVGWLPG